MMPDEGVERTGNPRTAHRFAHPNVNDVESVAPLDHSL